MRSIRAKLAIGAIGAAAVGLMIAPAVSAAPPTCNWGDLTSEAIASGFEQGPHSSDQANPRVGLANVVVRGDLNRTCELIASLW